MEIMLVLFGNEFFIFFGDELIFINGYDILYLRKLMRE
jgi:hypothetical protein